MSRIHQALTRTLPTPNNASRFNPLRRSNPANTNRLWWLIAALALVLTALVIWAPWQSSKTVMATDPATLMVQSAPQSSSGAQPRPQIPEPAPEPVPQPPATVTAAVATPTEAAEPSASREADSPRRKAEQPSPVTAAKTPVTTATGEPTPVPAPAPAPTEAQPDAATDTRIRLDTDHQDQVQQALSNDDLAGAEMALRRWISEQPGAAQPRLWLAKLLLAEDRLDAIGALLEGQTGIEARGLLAVWHEKAGRPNQAVVLFEQLAREQPRHSAWQLHWAINAENSGQLAQARLLYQTYLDKFAADNPSLTAFADQRIRSLERP